ncbi:MAG: hypothetical protein JNL01_09305 [Bdellovibrionales bacterium]|nr:hypothetical protein [Bdellovibrionales bacterium]
MITPKKIAFVMLCVNLFGSAAWADRQKPSQKIENAIYEFYECAYFMSSDAAFLRKTLGAKLSEKFGIDTFSTEVYLVPPNYLNDRQAARAVQARYGVLDRIWSKDREFLRDNKQTKAFYDHLNWSQNFAGILSVEQRNAYLDLVADELLLHRKTQLNSFAAAGSDAVFGVTAGASAEDALIVELGLRILQSGKTFKDENAWAGKAVRSIHSKFGVSQDHLLRYPDLIRETEAWWARVKNLSKREKAQNSLKELYHWNALVTGAAMVGDIPMEQFNEYQKKVMGPILKDLYASYEKFIPDGVVLTIFYTNSLKNRWAYNSLELLWAYATDSGSL